MFKFLYVTDLHGWTKGYEEILNISLVAGIDTIVNGGDMLPKGKDLVFTQQLFIEEYLDSYCQLLESYNISYYSMFGNDDCMSVLPSWNSLTTTYKNIYDLTECWLPFAEHLKIRGCNYIPDAPFGLKDWCVLDSKDFKRPPQYCSPVVSEENGLSFIDNIDKFFNNRPTLENILKEISDEVDSQKNSIFVCHSPPASVGLGNVDKHIDVGSTALYKWIVSTQPLLSLHGHIHESPQVTGVHTAKIGNTTAHQPGQQKLQNKLLYSIISIEDGSVDVERCVKRL